MSAEGGTSFGDLSSPQDFPRPYPREENPESGRGEQADAEDQRSKPHRLQVDCQEQKA